MQIIKNEKVKETVITKTLKNGLTLMIIPKEDVRKKYVIWGTKYGSNDSEFMLPGQKEKITVPKGVAHFLEHKLFEQENGTNSLDTLTALGVNANAYTTNDHTAYLFECTENFYLALDELMDYVQKPHFTDENVEKEKGIIGQEIMMYDDYPEWRVYLNAMEAMYHNHPVKLDITGTIETISHIDKEVLYKCYNTFYNPKNMLMVVCGDFAVEEIVSEVEKRLIDKETFDKIERIMPSEPEKIVKSEIVQELEVSQPIYMIGIKDSVEKESTEQVKKHLAIEIMLLMLMGASSKLYKKLHDNGVITSEPGMDYEFATDYAHITISGKSVQPNVVLEELKNEIASFRQNGIDEKMFERMKKMIYGLYIKEYEGVAGIARMFLSDYFKGINSFEYLDHLQEITLEYVTKVFNKTFKEENMIISIIKGK